MKSLESKAHLRATIFGEASGEISCFITKIAIQLEGIQKLYYDFEPNIPKSLSFNFFTIISSIYKTWPSVQIYILKIRSIINFYVSIFDLRTFSSIRAESDIGQHILQPRKYKRSNCEVAGKKNKEGKKKSWKSRRREKTVQTLHHRTVSQRHVSTIEEKWNPHLPLSFPLSLPFPSLCSSPCY